MRNSNARHFTFLFFSYCGTWYFRAIKIAMYSVTLFKFNVESTWSIRNQWAKLNWEKIAVIMGDIILKFYCNV